MNYATPYFVAPWSDKTVKEWSPGTLMKRILLVNLLAMSVGIGLAAGNTLVVGLYQDVATLNPAASTSAANLRVSTNIVEPLFRVDRDTGGVVPHLALSWEQVDEVTIQLHLREGVQFTNGEPMDAAAVKFSLETTAAQPVQAVALGQLDHVDIVDEYTVNVVSKSTFPLMPLSLAMSGHVMPPVYYSDVGKDGFAEHPIGTGPFVFEKRVTGQSITLVRNEEYWNGVPEIERVEYRPIPEDTVRLAALLAGEIDIATNLPASANRALESSNGVYAAPQLGFAAKQILLDDLDGSPIADQRIRQAINYAVDKNLILETLYEGMGIVSTCQLATPVFNGYNPDLEPYAFDPERARQLVAESGAALPIEVEFKYRATGGDKELSEVIAAMLEDVGFRVKHTVLEGGEYLRQLSAFELRNLATAGIVVAPDAQYIFNTELQTGPYSYYRNPEFDAVVLEAQVEIDPVRRRALLQQAAKVACENPPIIFLFSLEDLYGVSDRVIGWQPSPDYLIYLDGVSLR